MINNIVEHISNITEVQFIFCWFICSYLSAICLELGIRFSATFRKILAKKTYKMLRRLIEFEGIDFNEASWCINEDGTFGVSKRKN